MKADCKERLVLITTLEQENIGSMSQKAAKGQQDGMVAGRLVNSKAKGCMALLSDIFGLGRLAPSLACCYVICKQLPVPNVSSNA